ncbi:MAG: TraE/TraK family type IV conjugative transfer system protein [Candidatus Nanopelagicales bacterium]
MNKRYSDLVYNQATAIKAWKTTTVLTSIGLVAAVIAMAYMATHQTTILVPQTVSAATGPLKVAADKKQTSAEYLSFIASADLSYALDWTPATVSLQFSRFLNRMSPAAYAVQQVALIAEAATHTKESESQSFYPVSTQVVGSDTVKVTGTLARWEGDKQIFRQATTYIITYTTANGGMPYVESLSTQ